MRRTKGRFHLLQMVMLVVCAALVVLGERAACATEWPVGVFLEDPGTYTVTGFIGSGEWKWEPAEKAWRGFFITIRVTGGLKATWKKFAERESDSHFEVSQRTRGQAYFPALVLLHDRSASERPGDLVWKQVVTVKEPPGAFFPVTPKDLLLGGREVKGLAFDSVRAQGLEVNLPTFRVYPDRPVGEARKKAATMAAETAETVAEKPEAGTLNMEKPRFSSGDDATDQQAQPLSGSPYPGNPLGRMLFSVERIDRWLVDWQERQPWGGVLGSVYRAPVGLLMFLLFAWLGWFNLRPLLKKTHEDPHALSKSDLPVAAEAARALLKVFEKHLLFYVLVASLLLFYLVQGAASGKPLNLIDYAACGALGALLGMYQPFRVVSLFGIAVFGVAWGLSWGLGELAGRERPWSFDVVALGGTLSAAVLWWNAGRSRQNRLFSQAGLWAAKVLTRRGEWEEVDRLVSMLEGSKKIDPVEVLWLKARAAKGKGDKKKAVSLLESHPPDVVADRLLFSLYAEDGAFPNIEERVRKHSLDQGVALLEELPRTRGRDRLLLKLWSGAGKWKQIQSFLESRDAAESISLLEGLPRSPERDDLLIDRYHRNRQLQKIVSLLAEYDEKKGREKILKRLPKGAQQKHVLALFLYKKGNLRALFALLSAMEVEKSIELARELPAGKPRDLLFARLCIHHRVYKPLAGYFQKKAGTKASTLLKSFEPSLTRDRFLARFLEEEGEYGKVLGLLEPHHAKGALLSSDDVKRLARAYGKKGKRAAERKAWEDVLAKEALEDEALTGLCRVSLEMGESSAPLNRLEAGPFLKLEGDTLWALVQYHQRLGDPAKARAAAEAAVDLWKHKRAALFLGPLCERDGAYQRAAEVYAAAGDAGGLRRGLCLVRAGEYRQALSTLEKVSPSETNRKGFYYHVGYAHYQTGSSERAADAFSRADPERSDPFLQRDCAVANGLCAKKAMGRGDLSMAVRHYEEALSRLPAGFEAERAKLETGLSKCLYGLALESLLRESSPAEETGGFIEKARKYRQGAWQELDMLEGLLELKRGNPAQALKLFIVLNKRYPEAPALPFHKALSAAMLDEHRAYAKKVIESILSNGNGPDYAARARLLRGSIEIKEEKWEKAEATLRSASRGEQGGR